MFTTEPDWKAPSLSDLPSWEEAKRVSIDTETRDDHIRTLGIGVRRGGYMTGVSFAIEDGPSYYLPMRHEMGGNLPIEGVLSYLRDQAGVFTGDIIGANLSYDLDYLTSASIHFKPRYFRDIQIADPLINELHDHYSMEELAKRWRLPGKDESSLRKAAHDFNVDPKAGLWRLHAGFTGAYAEQDVRLPLQILRRQERVIEEEGLWDIYNLESRVIPVLVKMRQRGVLINIEKLEKIEKWSLQEEAKALRTVKEHTGIHLDLGTVWQASALAPALEKIGLKMDLTSTGQPSIDKNLLRNAHHPVADALLYARKVNKLRTTFAKSVRKHMVNGRIHCTLKQIAADSNHGDGVQGARYGRMSCMQPNLQQQPGGRSGKEFSSMWRAIYEPEKGSLWASCDYSQQEPRWTTHYAALLKFPGADLAIEEYRNNPKFDNHTFMAQLTGLPRDYAKNIFLGICYGEGGAKLCTELGLPTRYALSVGRERRILYFNTKAEAQAEARRHEIRYMWECAGEEGQKILDQFDERAPYIRMLAKEATRLAEIRGYIQTAGNRVLHFPMRGDGKHEWTHKALNRLVQGSSADQMKKALVEVDRDVPEFFMQLQVHDELTGSCPDPEVGQRVARVMENTLAAQVPFKVECKLGLSWGQAKKRGRGFTWRSRS